MYRTPLFGELTAISENRVIHREKEEEVGRLTEQQSEAAHKSEQVIAELKVQMERNTNQMYRSDVPQLAAVKRNRLAQPR